MKNPFSLFSKNIIPVFLYSHLLFIYFFKFWYAYVFPNTSALELGDTRGVYDLYIKGTLNHFASSSFENICIYYLKSENIKGNIAFKF